MSFTNAQKCQRYRRSWSPEKREEMLAKQRKRMESKRHPNGVAQYQYSTVTLLLREPEKDADSVKREGHRIFQILKDFAWAGHFPTMRDKAVELAFRVGLNGVRVLANRALSKARQPSKLFAWFLQNLEKVCKQKWAKWKVRLHVLPEGVRTARWGKTSNGSLIGNFLAQARRAIA